ncbi:hypothetical protein ACQKWADRAFT_316437 [Trichoderma austrokoningii]
MSEEQNTDLELMALSLDLHYMSIDDAISDLDEANALRALRHAIFGDDFQQRGPDRSSWKDDYDEREDEAGNDEEFDDSAAMRNWWSSGSRQTNRHRQASTTRRCPVCEETFDLQIPTPWRIFLPDGYAIWPSDYHSCDKDRLSQERETTVKEQPTTPFEQDENKGMQYEWSSDHIPL